MSKYSPTISVIIPAYNAEKTIVKTIESVRQQTYSNLEIIVIDDGSSDRTGAIISNIIDPRIKLFNYPNGGVAHARNRGTAKAQGEYIAFLDADDFWTEDKLKLQHDALVKNPQAGVAYSWTYFLYPEGVYYPSEPVDHQGNIYSQLLIKNFLHHGSNPLIRREAIAEVGEFDPRFPHCADWDYYLRLAAKWDFVAVPKHQVYYRQSANSMTSKIDDIEQQLSQMLEQTYQKVPEQLQHLQKISKSWIWQYCSQQYLEYGRDYQSTIKAVNYLWRSVKSYPKSLGKIYTYKLTIWVIKKQLKLLINSVANLTHDAPNASARSHKL
ncbi:MAG: glycosyltransferase [Cyanobacteria bacterium J06621_12]